MVVADTAAQYQQLVQEQFGCRRRPWSGLPAGPVPVAVRRVPDDHGRLGFGVPVLQANQELSKYIPVYVDINTDADNPAGEDLTLPLGAKHSGTTG